MVSPFITFVRLEDGNVVVSTGLVVPGAKPNVLLSAETVDVRKVGEHEFPQNPTKDGMFSHAQVSEQHPCSVSQLNSIVYGIGPVMMVPPPPAQNVSDTLTLKVISKLTFPFAGSIGMDAEFKL